MKPPTGDWLKRNVNSMKTTDLCKLLNVVKFVLFISVPLDLLQPQSRFTFLHNKIQLSSINMYLVFSAGFELRADLYIIQTNESSDFTSLLRWGGFQKLQFSSGHVHTWLGSELQILQFSLKLNIRCEGSSEQRRSSGSGSDWTWFCWFAVKTLCWRVWTLGPITGSRDRIKQ